MNAKIRFILVIALALLAGVALWTTFTQAAPGAVSLAGGSPTMVAYQGEVHVNGAPYSGNGYFKFAIVNAAGSVSYWSNDGSSAGGSVPTAAAQLTVSNGLFSVLLGDTGLSGMTQALVADVFSQPDRYLRVWFSRDNVTFNQLVPDTRITAVPYALQAQKAVDADTVDGLHASELETHYQNVVIVAQNGGDYTSVQAAINSITDAAASNPYLVWVAPGVYSETVTMKPYVHLQGAGQQAVIITSTVSSSSDWPPTQATLKLASDTSLRDLTVGNGGVSDTQTAVLATDGMTRTLVADVTAQALGNSVNNLAIFLSGAGTGVTLQQVTALAENGSNLNAGLINSDLATAVLSDGAYTARGGTNAWGVFNRQSGTLEATDIVALGENGSNLNNGLYNYNGAVATLHGGVFTGRGGNQTGGVANQLNAKLVVENVVTLAENGGGDNYSLANYDNSEMTVRGATVTARGGTNSYALCNEFNVTMDAESVVALAENGSNANYGLWNVNNAQATVRGGSFTGRGGTNAYGGQNSGAGTTLEAESLTTLGENGSSVNDGLNNYDSAEAVLRGGAFTGQGGANAYGINNESDTMLTAENVTALGGNGSNFNYGLLNDVGTATLHGGSFTGQGGVSAWGIFNTGDGSTLTANTITALGENGSSYNAGLSNSVLNPTTNVTQSVLEGITDSVYRGHGTVTVSNSRLVGGAVSGFVTCVAVSRGTTFNASGCP
jgi:hypothetical protein